MGISAKEFFKSILGKGIIIKFSTGKIFDPGEQVRTSAFEDFQKQKENEEDEK